MAEIIQTPEALLIDIATLIKEQSEVLVSGGAVDLAELETTTKKLCDMVAGLPYDKAVNYEPELKKIMDVLSDFSEQLVNRRNDLKTEMSNLNTQKKAQQAYNSNNSIPNPPTSD